MNNPDKLYSVADENVHLSHEDIRAQIRGDIRLPLEAALGADMTYKEIRSMFETELAHILKDLSGTKASEKLDVNRGTMRKWKDELRRLDISDRCGNCGSNSRDLERHEPEQDVCPGDIGGTYTGRITNGS